MPSPRHPLTAPPLLLALLIAGTAAAADTNSASVWVLPPPQPLAGKPLMQALRERRSTREFRTNDLAEPILSGLLWAAFGVNRAESGHRTAPSTLNSQAIDLYVATRHELLRFEATTHSLRRVCMDDVRRLTGGQDFVQVAPLALIYVADQTRLAKVPTEEREFYAAADTGFISQNVYLFCASEGLATVVHAVSDKTALAKAMGLRPDQKVVLAQAVGLPGP
jgi:nitroreductase